MRSVYVTGLGVVSALGIGFNQNRSALLANQSAIGYSKLLHSKWASILPTAELPLSTAALFEQLRTPKNLRPSRLVAMAALALEEAIGKDTDPSLHAQYGFINASSVGGMADVENHYADLIDLGNQNPEIIQLGDMLDCGDGTETLARHFGFKALIGTVSTACSSSANAIQLGARLIRQGQLNGVICGGADTLTRFTLNGFNSLKNIDRNFCRPFDANRNGLNLGEGAAYLVLESEESMNRSGRSPLAVLSGYCNYNEAFHPTAPSPEGEGAFQAMKGAIAAAGLTSTDISYINAHGTATISNDLAEAMAIQRVFRQAPPPFSSTKCYTGHTLAAAGAIEAVYCISSLLHDELYANLRFEKPMEEVGIAPITTTVSNSGATHIISNSFGFGGNNASLLFSRYA